MKKYLWLILMISFLGILAGCVNKIIEDPEIEKSELVEYCEANGGYIGGTEVLICYFQNSSCIAKDFYNGDCLPQEESEFLYNEELAELYCKKSYGTISSIDIGGEEEKICIFPDESVCSFRDIFYGECDNED